MTEQVRYNMATKRAIAEAIVKSTLAPTARALMSDIEEFATDLSNGYLHSIGAQDIDWNQLLVSSPKVGGIDITALRMPEPREVKVPIGYSHLVVESLPLPHGITHAYDSIYGRYRNYLDQWQSRMDAVMGILNRYTSPTRLYYVLPQFHREIASVVGLTDEQREVILAFGPTEPRPAGN